MLDCTLLLTLVVMWLSWWHHAHIVIQSYTYNHTVIHIQPCNGAARRWMNQGPGKNYTHTMCKCSRCLLRCWCVHSIPFLQVTELLIDLGQATNMNWYRCNHVGWHAVTNCVWSCACHHDIMCTLSYYHTHTILQIQAYTYNHAMMPHTGTWRIPMRSSTNT